MFIVLLIIIGFSVLVLAHEAGHFFAARFFNLKIDEFGFGFPPRIFSKRKGETEYSLNWLPFGGFVRIAGENDKISGNLSALESLPEEEKKRYFLFQSGFRRSLIILAGVFVNFVLGWLILSGVFMVGSEPILVINEVQTASPAESIGLKAGDVIVGYAKADDFIKFVDENRGKEIELLIRRNGYEKLFKVVPRVEPKENEGAIGVSLVEGGIPKKSFFGALSEGLKQSLNLALIVIYSLYELIRNLILKGSLIAEVAGPVGIIAVAHQVGGVGLIYLFQFLGLISVNLAVINLLPFPALDGGRFFLIVLEKIKGSPVSLRTEAIINGIGFAFLLFLIIVISIRDIIRLF